MNRSALLKMISLGLLFVAAAFVVSGSPGSALQASPIARAALPAPIAPAVGADSIAAQASQPTPIVSVTTLPQMPGSPTTLPATQQPSGTFPPIAPPVDNAGHSIITVDGDVGRPLALTLKDLEKMRPTSLTLRIRDADGKQRVHSFTGALLSDVIQQARPRFADDPATLMRKYVYVTGVDGSAAIVGFPEFAPAFNGKVAILAYLVDLKNVPTPGFAQLVIAEDATRVRFLTVARLTVGEPGH